MGFHWPIFKSRLADFNYKRVDIGVEDDLEKLSNIARGGTLFGANHELLVVVLQDDDLAEEVSSMVRDSQDSVWVLASLDHEEAFEGLDIEKASLPSSQSEIRDWIQTQVLQLDGEIDSQAADLLAGEVHSVFEIRKKSKADKWTTLTLLRQDLKSMIDFADDRKITPQIAKDLLTINFEESIFEILRKMSEKDSKEALEVYKTLLDQGVSVYQLIPLLSSQLLDWLMISKFSESGKDQDAIQEATGWKSGRVWAVKNEAEKYTKSELERAVARLLEIDLNNKTSQGEPEISLAGWVAELATR